MSRLLLLTVLFPCLSLGFSDDSSSTRYVLRAVRLQQEITVDGLLDERTWVGPAFSSFVQSDPVEGGVPTQQTDVWLAYDEHALYVAARLHDSRPESVSVRLARRDEFFQTDKFTVYLDGYRDRQTGSYFTVTASGVQIDGVLYNDEWDDNDWDGVWESATQVDEVGWTVEMRIPFSQLRFHDDREQTWGINFRRDISRNNEQDYVTFRPREGSGFVSRFSALIGIRDIQQTAGIEVTPYITTRAQFSPASPGDPFNDGSAYLPGAGFDLRTTIAGNLSLTATVNPDFGQVEVDPDVVNLSDFESFFPEKRPFFVEGSSLFSNFGRGGANSNWSFNFSNPNFFYSRRIGRSPHGSLPSADFADVPSGTNILGAGKVSGKVNQDLTVATLHALTNREYARISANGDRRSVELEPYTYYGVVRVQQNIADRRYGIGLLGTAVERFFGDDRLRQDMNRNAYVGGVDGWVFLDADRQYVINGWVTATNVTGTPQRVTDLQRSSMHYFQRPDARHVSVDTSATSLSGYAFRMMLNKQEGPWMLNAAFGGFSPGFNANDAGFIWRTDLLNGHVAAGYKWSEPTSWYRSASIRAATFATYSFGGQKTWHGYWMNSNLELTSYWSLFGGAAYNPPTMSDRTTRGGPLMFRPAGLEVFGGFNSDSKQNLVFETFFFQYLGGGGHDRNVEFWFSYRPTDGVQVSLSPGFSTARSDRQWVTSYEDAAAGGTFGSRYVFADFDQKTFSATLRLNWIFSPTLSLQVYTQALFSSGAYRNLKSLRRGSTDDFLVFGEEGSTILPDNPESPAEFMLDADGTGPGPLFVVDNPDFSRTSMRGNAVLRWQYAPGSALYVVWTQSRWDNLQDSGFFFRRSLNRLALAPAENIFMLKFTYWWNT